MADSPFKSKVRIAAYTEGCDPLLALKGYGSGWFYLDTAASIS